MEDLIQQAASKFLRVLEVVKQDLNTIRTGKASPQLLESVPCDVYGTRMKLVELATMTASDPTMLVVTPFDVANAAAIAKAIQDANLGLTAVVEDTVVRVIVPPLSEERRQEYVKLAKTKVEGGKVMARQVRHDTMEDIGKMEADEDTRERLEKDLQKLTDETVEKLDLLAADKERELLTV